jgi:hypothetical protein
VSYQIRKEKYPTAGWWFSLGTPISATKVVTEIFLKVVLNTQHPMDK